MLDVDTFLDDILKPDYAADARIDADPIGWITGTNPANPHGFPIPELNGAPMTLYPSQAEPLREALRRLDNGDFAYSTVVWSDIKKSAKSSIAAAVGLWFAFRKPFASVKVIANDLKQAESRVYYYMRRAVTLHPVWTNTVRITNYKMTLPNGSTIEAIPVDPKGEAGGNDDFVIYSELWGWKNKAALTMWTESTLSPTKFGQSMRWCETYAGYVGESPVLEQLYETGVKHGQRLSDAHEIYANGRTFALWRTGPHLPWQTDDYYAQEAGLLTEPEYLRVHRNAWQDSVAAFVPFEWWTACRADLPPMAHMQPCLIALDAAVSGDCFAVLMVSRQGETVQVRYARAWTPPKDGQINFAEPEAEVRRLVAEYPVIEVAFDAYQLADMAQRLRRAGIHCRAFNQGADRLEADKMLYDNIRDRRVAHAGLPDLDDHIRNANAQQQGDGKLRIVKRREADKIDLAVALSMANSRARALNLG